MVPAQTAMFRSDLSIYASIAIGKTRWKLARQSPQLHQTNSNTPQLAPLRKTTFSTPFLLDKGEEEA